MALGTRSYVNWSGTIFCRSLQQTGSKVLLSNLYTVLVLIYDRIQAMTLGIRRMNELILSVVWIYSAASVNIHQDYQNTKTFYQKTWVRTAGRSIYQVKFI